ncbi:MAG: hypothetical protein ACRDOK_05470 [Streptosporangiaceae bacterium]
MEVRGSGAVSISLHAGEADTLGRQLVKAIRVGWTARGLPPPRLLTDLANEMNATVRRSAAERAAGRSAPCAEPQNAAALPLGGSWLQPYKC